VVVSEETGTISLVSEGRIRRDLDARSLKQSLLTALEVDEELSPESELPRSVPARGDDGAR
jgi:hypothetical protein